MCATRTFMINDSQNSVMHSLLPPSYVGLVNIRDQNLVTAVFADKQAEYWLEKIIYVFFLVSLAITISKYLPVTSWYHPKWLTRSCEIIWVRSRNCGCLVTWFCYQLIAKPGNKTAAVSWPDPYGILGVNRPQQPKQINLPQPKGLDTSSSAPGNEPQQMGKVIPCN